MRAHKGSCVLHVGAGLSTAAGIPDFRGKNGVWTKLLARDEAAAAAADNASTMGDERKPTQDELAEMSCDNKHDTRDKQKDFAEAEPTYAHMAIKRLCETGYVSHIVSQNVDGLFLKADMLRKHISELHGNFYVDECTKCRSRFVRSSPSKTMRLHKSNVKCPRAEACRGHLRDTILDWESPIPHIELRVASREAKRCCLHVCIGTSMQLSPSKDLVCKRIGAAKSARKRLVIVNLQPTKFDERADLVIHHFADDVFRELMRQLELDVPRYDAAQDPTKNESRIGSAWKK